LKYRSRVEVPEIAEKIKQIFQQKIDEREPPNRVWLTDTVYCGRKKIFAMLGFKQRFTEENLSKIWLGTIIHEALKDMGIASEVPVEYMGVRGRIDVLLATGEPMEVKVAGSMYVPASQYAESHVEQLSRYCLARGVETGVLFYYIPNTAITSLPAYRYRFDLKQIEEVTRERIELLKRAAEEKNPFMLPATWHSDTMDNWECRSCVFQQYCRAGSIGFGGVYV